MPQPRRVPRRRGQARQATIDAARALFAERGYQGVSVRDIAGAAEVSEALIFRNFGTKEQLFEEAVAEPYRHFLADFQRRWEQLEQPQGNAEMIEQFVVELYDFVREHRDLLFALVVASRFGALSAEASDAIAEHLSTQVRNLAGMTTREAQWRGLEHVDHELAASCTIAMVLAIVLLDDALFAHDQKRPDPQRLLRAMAAYAIGGVVQAQGA
jgi:AcrR family transcriptional regulator